MNGQKGHPLLQQIPLIKSPLYQPPRTFTLPSRYKQLPLQLQETHVTEDNLQAWIKECEHVELVISHYGESEKEEYRAWKNDVVKRLAPGYLGSSNSLLTPQKKQLSKRDETSTDNDIDRAFSTINIR